MGRTIEAVPKTPRVTTRARQMSPGKLQVAELEAAITAIIAAQLKVRDDRIIALEKRNKELEKSIDFEHDKREDLEATVKAQQGRITELEQNIIRLQATPTPAQEERSRTLVINGLVGVAGQEGDPGQQVLHLCKTHLRLPPPEVEDATRVFTAKPRGQGDGDRGRPDRVVVRFKTRAMAEAVWSAARRLKEENQRRKAHGEFTIGIDYELTEDERKARTALNSVFRAAKDAGKRCQWKRGELFVDGLPVTAPTSPRG